MRALIVTEFMSLDGVCEAPGGEPGHPHTGWTAAHHDDEFFAFKLRETLEAEALLLGRRTYEGFAAAWPQRSGEFADKMNRMPKHVVTSVTDELEWEASVRLDGDPVTTVADLKATDGGPLLVAGSLSLAQTLLAAGLVDELRLAVFPVVVGGGQRILVGDRRKLPFALASSQSFDAGIVLLVYRAAPA